MSVRMAGRQQRRKLCIFDQSERLIVPLPLLVLDNAALVVEFLLRHRAQQMSHAVTFKKQGNFQSGSRHRFEIIGPVEPGGAIEVRGPDLLQRFKEITGGIFRSIEHQMFEKMRKACLALGFVLRSDERRVGKGSVSTVSYRCWP